MDGISKFALSVKPAEKPKQVDMKPLFMKMDPYDYISLSSVAAALKTSRGRLAGQLLHIALQEFCDKLYSDRKDLATGISDDGVPSWPFYSPSVARDIDEASQGTFDFHGVSDEEDES